MGTDTKAVRKPTFTEAVIPIIFMAVVLVGGKGFLGWPAPVCLLIAAAFAGAMAIRLGYGREMIEKLIVDKIAAVMPPVLIVIFVGFMVGTWSYAGTMPMMIYYGMKFIDPKLILVIAFVSSAALSYISGASWGSAASIGVALMGVSNGMDIPPGYTAAAVVTGAYFGDKLSPLSDSTNLAAAVTKVPLYDHIKYMLWTTVPPTIISIIIYAIMGYTMLGDAGVSAGSNEMLGQLEQLFKFGFWPLLPMLVILVGTSLRMPTVPVLLLSSVVAIAVGAGYQGLALTDGITTTMNGFKVDMMHSQLTVLPSVVELINQGGLNNQGGFLAFIICAMGFAGIVTGTGMRDEAMASLMRGVRTCGSAVSVTAFRCVMINMLTGSDGLNKIITSSVMLRKFLQMRLHPVLLSRTIEDAGTMTGPLIPWSAAGLYMATTLKVPTLEYLPYCCLSFTSILFALIYAYGNINIKRITDDEASEMAKDRSISLN